MKSGKNQGSVIVTEGVGCEVEPMDIALLNSEKSHHLEELLRKWGVIEMILGTDDIDGAEDRADYSIIMEAPSALMHAAAGIPHSNFQDLLFKIAFWRWDATDLDDEPQKSDAMVLSALGDMAEFTGETIVLTDHDTRTPNLRSAQNA